MTMSYDSGVVFRITPEDVEEIIDFDPSITDLWPFIAAAEELVTEICASTANIAPGRTPVVYTANRLAIIETWLAAHFLAIRDPRYQSETISKASVSFQNQVGFNLRLTPYGQQAAMLDTNGGLSWLDQHISQGKRSRVGITWLGTRRDSRLTYQWRFFALGTG